MKLQTSHGNDADFILPDEGTYVMEFTTCEDAGPSTWPSNSDGVKKGEDPIYENRFKAGWTIREPDSDFDGIEVFEWFNQRTFSYYDAEKNKQSKFYPFFKAMLGEHYDPDKHNVKDRKGNATEEFDFDTLCATADSEGVHINVTIEHKTKKSGTFAVPTGASPIRKKKAAAPVKKAAAPVEPEEDDGDELFDDEEVL